MKGCPTDCRAVVVRAAYRKDGYLAVQQSCADHGGAVEIASMHPALVEDAVMGEKFAEFVREAISVAAANRGIKGEAGPVHYISGARAQ